MGAKKGIVELSLDAEILREKLAGLLHWERRKRREQIAAEICCYALLAALLAMPLYPLLAEPVQRWFIPVFLAAALAPFLWLRQRWRRSDTARAVARVDKTLILEERALTAWEILYRNETAAPALLVVKEAGEKLKTFDPRAQFARQWSWQSRLILPLLALWSGLLWFDIDGPSRGGALLVAPSTLAQKLREYSKDLQQKAEMEGLRESLQVGRELEKVAQRGIDTKTADDRFKTELAGMSKKLDAVGKSAAESSSFLAAESQQSLKDLKTELETAQDFLNLSNAPEGSRELSQSWLDRLAAMPQLKRQIDKDSQVGRHMGRNEVKSFFEKMEKQVTGELDRRTVLDAQQFLEQLMKQGQGEKGQSQMQAAGKGEEELAGDGQKEKGMGNLAGKEPGRKEEAEAILSQSQSGAPTRLKGLLGEGQSGTLVLKGKPSAATSEVLPQEVIASYRRQAEAELNTESVPAALKEAIKKYFLSLDAEPNKK